MQWPLQVKSINWESVHHLSIKSRSPVLGFPIYRNRPDNFYKNSINNLHATSATFYRKRELKHGNASKLTRKSRLYIFAIRLKSSSVDRSVLGNISTLYRNGALDLKSIVQSCKLLDTEWQSKECDHIIHVGRLVWSLLYVSLNSSHEICWKE